ncbi:amidohydrolase [Alkalicoccus luteus]|uniref:Amidohydrolase n=1 Tax=Alkalicoccus luteus TaxID=1237094 RepID=A0A969PMM1_9BACI|nr:amidohydrolase [Alkalicoccus luteus]NJP36987.1 amidohydrolase [Alkalicoccus luteus]
MGTLWFGGTIIPMTEEERREEAVFTKDGFVVALGSEQALRSEFASSIDREVDLRGGALYPGFIDSHLHMIGHGEKLLKLDVSSVTSLDQLKRLLEQQASAVPEGEWVLAEGFNENLYENRTVPDRLFLDDISVTKPIMITRVCRHAMVVNTAALQLAGISRGTESPSGGRIERWEDGEPTGYLHDQAQELIKPYLPKIDRDYVKRALETSLADLYQHGFTGGHTEDLFYYNKPEETASVFREVIGSHRKFRTNLLVHHEAADVIDTFPDSEFLKPGSVKLFADGALGGRTALLKAPYSDADTTGVAIHTPQQLESIVKKARAIQMPVAVHTIGDEALEMAVTAIENQPPPPGKRDRLIHLQVTTPELRSRLKKLDVVLDIQPRFTASDFPWVMDRLGQDRLPDSFAWKTLLEDGLVCAGGSDAPIEPVDPLLGIHAAVTRRRPEEDHDGWLPDQKLTLFEALRLFTSGSAAAVCEEDVAGIVEPGYRADFTVLSRDLSLLEPNEWLHAETVMTVVDDTIVYHRNQELVEQR